MKKILISFGLLLASIGVAMAAGEQTATTAANPTKVTAQPALEANNIIIKTPLLHQLVQNGATSGQVFMKLNNKSEQTITLIAANSMTANQTILQKSIERGDKQITRKVNKIALKPQTDTTLEPGGLHVALTGLKQTLHKGDSVPVLLIFDDGSSLTVHATVG